MARTHEERNDFEDRFFTNQQQQFNRFEDKLDANTDLAKLALVEAKQTNSRVTHLEIDVKQNLAEARKISNRAIRAANRVKERLVDLEEKLLPDKPPEDEVIHDKIESGDIRISKEAWWLIVKIVGFVGTALAIIVGVVNG